ncbi:MAG: hypothetical protein GY796_31970 [Chloroflexi bacterium]|nr:hypothetical protein [Chloroflexota bacterium]
MSGTYQLSAIGDTSTMSLFPQNPLSKRWAADQIATGGTREPIFSNFWQIELSFGTLQVQGENDYFESRFVAGGLYNAVLPHPITGALVGFTGTSIIEVSFSFNDIDRDTWANGTRVSLGVNLIATGSF